MKTTATAARTAPAVQPQCGACGSFLPVDAQYAPAKCPGCDITLPADPVDPDTTLSAVAAKPMRHAPAKPKATPATPKPKAATAGELKLNKAIRAIAMARLTAAGVGAARPATMGDLAVLQVTVEFAMRGLRDKIKKSGREKTTVTKMDGQGRILEYIREPIDG